MCEKAPVCRSRTSLKASRISRAPRTASTDCRIGRHAQVIDTGLAVHTLAASIATAWAEGGMRQRSSLAKSVHRRVAIRLIVAWLLLSAIFAPLTYYLEHRRLDDYLFDLARTAALRFGDHWTAVLEARRQVTDHSLSEAALAQSGFVGMRLFSTDKSQVHELWLPSHEAIASLAAGQDHAFPAPGRVHQVQIPYGSDLFVLTLIPLPAGGPGTVGYFEATYHVDPIILAGGHKRVRDTLIIVVLVIALTSVAIYPVIISLNRKTVHLSEDLMHANLELMETLGSAVAKRDSDTGLHNYRVTLYAIRLAAVLGVGREDMCALITGAFLHDVGKIAIPDSILLKPGKLSEAEFEIIKTHVSHGTDIVAQAAWLGQAKDVVAFHHEKFDGSGYERGLRAEAIPLNARLFAIVDVFDALTSVRTYKKPISLDNALAMMSAQRGRHFDPELLDMFFNIAPGLYKDIFGADESSLRRDLASLVHTYFWESSEGVWVNPPVGPA